MFNVATDSKLRGYESRPPPGRRRPPRRLDPASHHDHSAEDRQTGSFELTEPMREALALWLSPRGLRSNDD